MDSRKLYCSISFELVDQQEKKMFFIIGLILFIVFKLLNNIKFVSQFKIKY